jgi:hypothetical protein
MNLRCFGGQGDSVLANVIWVTVFNHAIYIVMMIPAWLIRHEEWRTVVGLAAPFGHPEWRSYP